MSVVIGRHAAPIEREQRGYRWVWPGVQGPDVAAPPQIRSRVFVTQELPAHPPGRFFQMGVQGPDVRQPVTDRILVRQELPWHPRSYFLPAPPPVPPVPAFRRALITTQQLPSHPGSVLRAGTPPIAYEDRQIFVIL